MINNLDIPKKLLEWYLNSNIQYPWRSTSDPYKIWLSETMLQQTQISTVIPFYEKWLILYPTLFSVANAPIDHILKAWEGLGYYARARNFHKACQIISKQNNQNIPNTFDQFIKLPGVGEYTASAVLSIAFNISLPSIDGNVIRVVSRVNSISLSYPKSKKPITKFLSSIIPDNFPGDFNQAIMDLGRHICKTKIPTCNLCPIKINCTAFVNNNVNNFPIKIKKRNRPVQNVAVGVIWNNDKFLIAKRPKEGLLGGLWELPGGKITSNETAKECIMREAREELLIDVLPYKHIGKFKHSYSHFSIIMDVYHCNYVNGPPMAMACSDFRWIEPNKLKSFAFPKANHKIFDKIFNQKANQI